MRKIPPSLLRYGTALWSVAIALLLELALRSVIQPIPAMLFFAAVMFSSWYSGFGPGLLATSLSTLCINYFFLKPIYGLNWTATDFLLLSVFVSVSLLISSLNAARRQAHKTLQRSEEIKGLLLAGVKDCSIVMLDPSGRVASWNEGAQVIWGYKESEILGRHFSCFYPPKDIEERTPDRHLAIAAAKGRFSAETRCVRSDGSEFWAHCTIEALRDEAGHLRGFAKVMRDITASKQTLEALRQSEERLQEILDNSPAAISLKDTQGRYILVNRHFEILFHLTRESVAGQTDFDLFPLEMAQAFRANDEQILEAETPREFEEIARHADGTHTYLSIKFPLIDSQGRIYAIGTISTDISDRVRAEEERDRLLFQIERQFRLLDDLLDASADYIYLLDRTGKCAYASQGAARALGLELSEMAGKMWREIGLSAAVAERFDAQCQAVMATGEQVRDEASFSTASGLRDFEYILSPFRGADGSVEAVVATLRDITDRKHAQQEREQLLDWLEAEHNLLETVLRQMPAGVVVAEAASGKVILANEQVRALLRKPSLEVDTLDEYWLERSFHPDGRPYRREEWPMVRCIAEGEVVIGEEIEMLRGDGTCGTARVNAAPIRDRAGRIVAGTATFYDITEHNRIEKAQRFLSEASTLLASSLNYEITLRRVAQLAVDFLADYCVIYLLGKDGQMRAVASSHADPEKAELTRELEKLYQPDLDNPNSLIGRTIRTAQSQLIAEVSDSLLQEMTSDSKLLRIFRELGPRSAMMVPMLSHQRAIGTIGFIASDSGRHYRPDDQALAEDLARRAALAVENARLYREAEEANRLKDEFLAIISHELRAPLTAILGWGQLLRQGQFDQSTWNRALETIVRNAKSQAQLIEDLLDIARLMRGKIRLQLGPVDLVALIEDILDAMRLGAEAKNLRLEAALDRAVPPISGDAERLQQVLSNLLSNAIKFTPPGGRVEIRLDRVDSCALIQVTDTGKGIHPAFLPFVFERFRQAEATTSRSQGGLGLGLAIVRHLVELHGGTVGANSAGEGQGATFTVKLPLANHRVQFGVRGLELKDSAIPHSGADTGAAPLGAPNYLEGLRVLIVDDEPDARDFLTTVLEECGAEVKTAASAIEALEVLQRLQPDVLVSDIGMPGEDGYSLIRQIRAIEAQTGGRIPAIALSAYAREQDRKAALSAGFQVHVPKPVEPDRFTRVVANLATGTPP